MAKLKIELEAIYKQADDALNKVTGSVDSYRKSLVAAGKQGEEFDKAMLRDITSVGERFGYEAKGIEKALALVNKQMSLLSQGVEADNSQLVKLTKTHALYQAELDKLNAAKAAEAQKTKEQIAAAEEMNVIQKQTIQMLEERSRIQNELNAKNANIGFMMLTGDEVGVANYTLKEYEQTLKQVIADTGINSEETRKALALYQEQARYVEALSNKTRGYDTSLKDLDKTSKSYLSRLVTLTKNILTFQLIMGPIRSAINGVKNTLRDSVRMAAEAEQVFSKLNTVFAGIEDSAQRAANSIASTLGVANSTAASALSTVGDLLQAQGMGTAQSLNKSSEWVSQFQDIIAFKDINMSLEEFAQNFMSGAAGNLRNFRTFGSIVKESAVNARLAAQGLDKLTGSELELAKMTTRAEIALEQQANAMGATKREWDTMLSINRRLTEAQKEFKENLGNEMNTFLKPIKQLWTDILDGINKATEAQRQFNAENPNSVTEGVFNLSEGSSDRKVFRNELIALLGPNMDALRLFNGDKGTMSDSASSALSQINNTIRYYGASVDLVTELFGDTIPDAVYSYLRALEAERNAVIEQNKENTKRAESWSLLTESASAFLESLAGVKGVDISSQIAVFNRRVPNLAYGTQEQYDFSAQQIGVNRGNAISAAIESIKNQLPESYIGVIDRLFGDTNKQKGYEEWLNNIKALYVLLYNREIQFGDVGQDTLNNVIALWAQVNGEAHEYLANIERINKATSDYNALGANYSGIAAGYRTDMANIGLSSDQITRNSLLSAFEEANAKRSPAARAIKEALDAFDDLLKAQDKYNKKLELEASIKAKRDARAATEIPTEYQTQLAQFGMSDRDLLVQQRNELASKHDPLWVAIQREIDAFDELEKKTRELALAETWAATGERALGATGTLGSVVGQFTDGKGDTWSDIVNALLTIMENTEGWADIAATLDQIFEMFEPVVDAIINLIVALPWSGIIKALKIVASAIVIITGIVRGIVEVIKWLWDNISAALHNIWEAITHPLGGGSYASFRSFDNLMDTIHKVAADTQKELGDIKDVNENIERNTRDDDVLKTLKELYASGIINENQFYAGARVIQKDKVFDPVPAGSPKYLSSPSQTSTTISYGGVTLQFNGGDTEEIKRWLLNLFNGNGIPYNTAIGG